MQNNSSHFNDQQYHVIDDNSVWLSPDRWCENDFLVLPKELKKERRLVASPNCALVPDCGDSCNEVYMRCIERHSKTYLYGMTSEEEMPPGIKGHTLEGRLMTDRVDNVVTKRGQSDQIPLNQSPSQTKSFKCVLSFSGAVSSEVINVDVRFRFGDIMAHPSFLEIHL